MHNDQKNKKHVFLGLIAVGLVIFGLYWFLGCRSFQVKQVLGEDIRIIQACSTHAKLKGLGGTSREVFESRADAMIFHYKTKEVREFWMRGMQYSIDIVWVRDGQVVKIEKDVQPPAKGEDPTRMSSTPFKIDTVVELPSGGIAKYGIAVGMYISAFDY